MSPRLGSENFSGSEWTSASRSSFGNANPIVDPSGERESQTIRPIRNFWYPRTTPSLVRGRLLAKAQTSSTVTTTEKLVDGYDPPLIRLEEGKCRRSESCTGSQEARGSSTT